MTTLQGNSDMDKFRTLGQKPYAEQAKWFLNAFWEDVGEKNADDIWTYSSDFAELDEKNGKDGGDLEEIYAHRFLEKRGETLTVREMRDILRKIDIDSNKRMSITEYLVFRYKQADPQVLPDLVNAIQGNKEMVDEAARLLEVAMEAVREANREADEARVAEAAARAAEARCRELEAPLKAAEEEVRAAQAELKAQEDAYNNKKAELTDKSENAPGMVGRNKAKNELQQLLAEDPLPLRRAQTTTEAALRRAEKARAPFKAATEKANAAAEHAAEQRAEAEAAEARAQAAFKEAEDYLELAKKSVPKGSIWWMEREIFEARKFMPQSKGGIAKR